VRHDYAVFMNSDLGQRVHDVVVGTGAVEQSLPATVVLIFANSLTVWLTTGHTAFKAVKVLSKLAIPVLFYKSGIGITIDKSMHVIESVD